MTYLILKFFHVLGAFVILGTGTGIAFFMLMAHRSGDPAFVAQTAKTVVIADMIFTATAVTAQPVTGYLLARETGHQFEEFWLFSSLVLFGFAGLFWLPVVWMQARMAKLAKHSAENALPLPEEYTRLFRIWFIFGFPGFGAVVVILWMMIAKPGAWG